MPGEERSKLCGGRGLPALTGLLLAALISATAVSFAVGADVRAQRDADGVRSEGQRPALDTAPDGSRYVAGELLVTYEHGKDSLTGRTVEAVGADLRQTEELPDIDAAVVEAPVIGTLGSGETRERRLEDLRRELEETPGVASADYNYWREPTATVDDPGFGRQYGLEQIRAPRAWDSTLGGDSRIAVVDTGIDGDHPDLSNKIAAQRDLVNDDNRAEEAAIGGGHGTHVAGIAAAATDNGRGVAGTAPEAKLYIAKAIGDSGGSDADIAQAINWSANQDADVINLSLGGPQDSGVLKRAVDRAREMGSLPVAAAGNDGDSTVSYPAAYPSAVAVAATNADDTRASYSSTGRWVDVAAPGSGVYSTLPDDAYGRLSGTSMASPHAAGVAGLLASQGYTADGIDRRLRATAVDKGPEGRDAKYGAGRIDAARAVAR